MINSINLCNFRNYERFEVDFNEKINFIYGLNGQGKTNLIESVYFLTHLRSFRTNKIRYLYRNEERTAQIRSYLTKQAVSHGVYINLENDNKRVFVDRKSLSYSSEYIKKYFSILFSPDLLSAFKEYPLERRGFFDRILVLKEKKYLNQLKDFNKIKKQKNVVLKNKKLKEIDIWNRLLAKVFPDISQMRDNLVKEINRKLAILFEKLTGRKERLELHYRWDLEDKARREEDSVYEFLNSKMEVELFKGYSLYGPHKDDFWMTINGKRDKLFFSQGEYRISFLALQLALNLIITETLDFNPVILLDDIFSELDEKVYQRTLEYIAAKDSQVFITSTSIPKEYRDIGKAFKIDQGRLVQ